MISLCWFVLGAAAALSQDKHLHHLWRAWYIFYWLEIICEIQRNEDLPVWLVLWLTNVLNACSWGFLFSGIAACLCCCPSSSQWPWPGMAVQSLIQHAAFQQCLSLLDIVKCQGTLLLWLHPVLVPEHSGIFPSTMEGLFLRQNCLL